MLHSKYRKPTGRKTGKKSKASEVNQKKAAARWSKEGEGTANPVAATTAAGNVMESEVRPSTPTGRPSTSARKMQFYSPGGNDSQEEGEEDETASAEFLLIHTESLQSILNGVVCRVCKNGKPQLLLTENHGLVKKVTLKCTACLDVVAQSYTSPRIPITEQTESTRPPFLCNRKIVHALLDVGIGHTGLQRFCAAMNMSGMSIDAYMSHLHELIQENKRLREEILALTIPAVRKAHEEENPSLRGQEVIDIAVSFDGSWPTRGHSSLSGFVSAIDILTGLVVDYHVFCRYCHVCTIASLELGPDSEDFKKWQKEHRDCNECDVNYSGSAPAMEMYGAEVLWRRSVELNKMRYTSILSDGDSKTVTHLNSMEPKPYGPDVTIEKEECLNHLSKRVGTSLRNLVSEEKARGVTLGGKAVGALTDSTIIKLQSYYHKAIKENMPDIPATQKAIMATLDHMNSTDQKPKHQKCPEGANSWCFYNRAKALNPRSRGRASKTKTQAPAAKKHSEMSVSINDQVYAKVKPIYERLSSTDLLSKCARLGTQNANESLHNVIWKKCKKTTFLSRKKYEIGITRGIGEFNMGLRKLLELKSSGVSDQSTKIATSIDRKRKAQSSGQEEQTKKRAKRKVARKKSSQAAKKKEGVTYQAGGF